jgi:hypothetical protein
LTRDLHHTLGHHERPQRQHQRHQVE